MLSDGPVNIGGGEMTLTNVNHQALAFDPLDCNPAEKLYQVNSVFRGAAAG